MFAFRKIWRALFSCYLRFDIFPFPLLLTISVSELELFCLALICFLVFNFDEVISDFILFDTWLLHKFAFAYLI